MNLGVKRARASVQPIKQVPQYGVDAYSLKVPTYFAGVRTDYVAELPVDPDASILEIGCGSGGTGALALEHKKCGRYCGVEIDRQASENARLSLTEVVTGNIEELDLPWPPEHFDAVILSEVLEHLVDPWAVMRKLRPLLKPGGLVFASSPNVSHYRLIAMLLRGEWNLSDFGPLDRTHLRWFTPKSYRALFESCGYMVDWVGEHTPFNTKARIVNFFTFGRTKHLFTGQVDLRAHCPPTHP